jgi:hypothetical protein
MSHQRYNAIFGDNADIRGVDTWLEFELVDYVVPKCLSLMARFLCGRG